MHKYRCWESSFCCPKERCHSSPRRPPGHELHLGKDLLPPLSISSFYSVWEKNTNVDKNEGLKHASEWHVVPSCTVAHLGSLFYSWPSHEHHERAIERRLSVTMTPVTPGFSGGPDNSYSELVKSWADAYFSASIKAIYHFTLCSAKDECSGIFFPQGDLSRSVVYLAPISPNKLIMWISSGCSSLITWL